MILISFNTSEHDQRILAKCVSFSWELFFWIVYLYYYFFQTLLFSSLEFGTWFLNHVSEQIIIVSFLVCSSLWYFSMWNYSSFISFKSFTFFFFLGGQFSSNHNMKQFVSSIWIPTCYEIDKTKIQSLGVNKLEHFQHVYWQILSMTRDFMIGKTYNKNYFRAHKFPKI